MNHANCTRSVRLRRSAAAATLALAPLLLVFVAAMTSGCRSAASSPATSSLEDLMTDVVGPGFEDMLVEIKRDTAAIDLARIRATSLRMADAVATAHRHEAARTVPDFATYATECEAWLRELAAAADAGDRARVVASVRDAEPRHCNRCHDAVGAG